MDNLKIIEFTQKIINDPNQYTILKIGLNLEILCRSHQK